MALVAKQIYERLARFADTPSVVGLSHSILFPPAPRRREDVQVAPLFHDDIEIEEGAQVETVGQFFGNEMWIQEELAGYLFERRNGPDTRRAPIGLQRIPREVRQLADEAAQGFRARVRRHTDALGDYNLVEKAQIIRLYDADGTRPTVAYGITMRTPTFTDRDGQARHLRQTFVWAVPGRDAPPYWVWNSDVQAAKLG